MNAAARELGLIAAEKARQPIREKAQQMLAAMGRPRDPRLEPPLILTIGDRL